MAAAFVARIQVRTLTISGCTIAGNTAAYDGGGLANISGTTKLTGCTISGNLADDGRGGGVLIGDGTATLINCTVSGNNRHRSWGLRRRGGHLS